MTDNGKNREVEPRSLSISIDSKGEMNVSGPGNGKFFNEMLCFYMLEKAKDFIKERNRIALIADQAMQNKIHKPSVIDFARDFKK